MNRLDDDEARKLLGPLADEPDGPQRLDLAEITRAGARRRTNRRLATSGLTAVALAAGWGAFLALQPGGAPGTRTAGHGSTGTGPSAAAALPPDSLSAPVGAKCLVTPLAGPTGRVYAVDRTGHYAVEIRDQEGSHSAVIWKDGQLTRTVALPAFDRVEVAVNATGELALTLGNDQDTTPYAYIGGKLTRLEGGGYVTDIADDGRIGGASGNKPVIWQNPDAEPTQLALPRGTVRGEVIGFDSDGTILGTAQNGDNTRTTVVLWRNGGSSAQIVKVPAEYAARLSVGGIRDGKVVGTSGPTTVFSYDIATAKFTKQPKQVSFVQGFGGKGTIVGAPTDSVPLWAVVDGTAHELATLNGITSYSILRVADDGRTVFGNSWQDDRAQPTKWTCG